MSIQYDNYLYEHCDNVVRGLQWMRDHLPHVVTPDIWAAAMEDAEKHDESKWDKCEYGQYDRYFYGDRSYQVVHDFDYAWLHHIHQNSHHWQYWILFEDDPVHAKPYKALQMPEKDILHMIADWWSFSWKTGNYGEIFKWYKEHEKKIILHTMTKVRVVTILDELKQALIREGMMDDHEMIVEIQEPIEPPITDIQIVEEQKEEDPVSHSAVEEEANETGN